MLRLADVSKRFGATPAIEGVSFEVRRGEIVGIIGRSGAGKSTLIRCLNGLEKPDSGRIEVLGEDIAPLGERDLRRVRLRVGMIFQHFNLLSSKTVADNVALPLKIAGRTQSERRDRVRSLLWLVGLEDKAAAYPGQLSGGQKQRVGIARALAADPALLLSDEATSALDPETTASILALLRDINRKLGLTIVLITHEMSVVRAIAGRVIVLDHGRIVEEGEAGAVFDRPQAALTRRLLAAGRHDALRFQGPGMVLKSRRELGARVRHRLSHHPRRRFGRAPRARRAHLGDGRASCHPEGEDLWRILRRGRDDHFLGARPFVRLCRVHRTRP